MLDIANLFEGHCSTTVCCCLLERMKLCRPSYYCIIKFFYCFISNCNLILLSYVSVYLYILFTFSSTNFDFLFFNFLFFKKM